jgi:hypothetical protein
VKKRVLKTTERTSSSLQVEKVELLHESPSTTDRIVLKLVDGEHVVTVTYIFAGTTNRNLRTQKRQRLVSYCLDAHASKADF